MTAPFILTAADTGNRQRKTDFVFSLTVAFCCETGYTVVLNKCPFYAVAGRLQGLNETYREEN